MRRFLLYAPPVSIGLFAAAVVLFIVGTAHLAFGQTITQAVYVSHEVIADNSYRITVDMTTASGTRRESFAVQGKTIAELLRALTKAMADRNSAQPVKDALAALTPGFVIPVVPSTTPLEDAREVYRSRLAELKVLTQLSALGVTPLPKTVAAALTDVNAALAAAPNNATRLVWIFGQ